MGTLSDKEKLLRNFSRFSNWEEKYLYIVELGARLPPIPAGMHTVEHLLPGCQSQVWIVVLSDNNGFVRLYGDSDAVIVKGLIAIVFILYQGLTPAEIIGLDARPFFNQLALAQHLTPSRSQGLDSMLRTIYTKVAVLQ